MCNQYRIILQRRQHIDESQGLHAEPAVLDRAIDERIEPAVTCCFHLTAGLFEQPLTQRLNTRLEVGYRVGRLHGLFSLPALPV